MLMWGLVGGVASSSEGSGSDSRVGEEGARKVLGDSKGSVMRRRTWPLHQ